MPPIDAAPLVPPGLVSLGGGRWHFSVWAPAVERAWLHVLAPDRLVALERGPDGVHRAAIADLPAGARYRIRLAGADAELPDPASRHQPDGVDGPSSAFDPAATWSDAGFRAPPIEELVIYEAHIGTFTPRGTFDAAIERLDRLVDLGVNALEIMPVAEFPGGRNWGYDGVFPWAVQSTYGGPSGLARLVDACHARGLAVLLDVVYNHLGPEGACLARFGPYFSARHVTDWGAAFNFDGPHSDEVRRYFIESARYFARDLHVDGFRLDAIHAIVDTSALPFLAELTASLRELGRELGRPLAVIAECDRNDARVVAPWQRGGLGADAQWSDDFHHALHSVLTGERSGYYADFGELGHLARAIADGWVYAGEYSRVRSRRHGNSAATEPGRAFVVCTQNHDQVGNRARGDRLSETLSPAEQRLAAAVLLTMPYVPLLFMGQEVGERAPFQYFTSHRDPDLAEAVRRGRRAEFAAFGWRAEDIPDPQDAATFERSRLSPGSPDREGAALFELHRELLRLRRARPALARLDRERTAVTCPDEDLLLVQRWSEPGPAGGGDRALLVASFAREPREVALPRGRWRLAIDTDDPRWRGEPRGESGDDIGPRVRVAPRSALLLVAPGPQDPGPQDPGPQDP